MRLRQAGSKPDSSALFKGAHYPALYQWSEIAEGGGFASCGPRIAQIPEVTARLAVRLFRGTKVADFPVEQPAKFEPVINLKTADALGLTVPPALLARADEVIE